MSHRQPDKAHILFLFSDTGGGHRSAAEAIIEALDLEFPGHFTTEMVDFFKDYAPPPFEMAPRLYAPMAKVPDIWEWTYRISDGGRRTRAIYRVLWPYIRRAAYGILADHPSDLIVSVHPVINTPMIHALGPEDPQYITVVTDLVSTHAAWYHHGIDLVLVPTEAARQRGIYYGLSPEQIEVVGLPVANKFCQPVGDKQTLRSRLGWPQDLPVVLLVGGGEGMGPLEETARAIAEAQLQVALVVVTGRNRTLRQHLETVEWPLPTFIYGFVTEMPDFMRAADVLVTKAGPGTISEAFIAGLPILLYSRMPGQEDGNVTYVIGEGAGLWAPRPEQVVRALREWLDYPERREQVAAASRRLARPDAARRIARILALHLSVRV